MENQTNAAVQYKKMTETPLPKLISSLAVPSVISMLVTTVYNITDTYFVSKINVSASGAAGIVFSLMAIIQAFGFMFGHGSGSCISRHLGSRDIDSARVYASTGFFASLVFGAALLAAGLVFLSPLMKLLGSTDTILPYASDYCRWILIAAPAMTTSCTLNNILRYEGMAALSMYGLCAGSVINIALDPILIFKLDMGIAGAGIATAVSQYISLAVLLSVFIAKKTQSRISFKYISFKPRTIGEIMYTGLPSLARQGLNSISTMTLNVQAGLYGDECIAAMSIVARLANLLFCICVGIGQGFQPVSAFNYGAKKYSRVKSGMTFTWLLATAVTAVLSAVSFVFSDEIIAVFRDEAQIVETGSFALKALCCALLLLPTVMLANMTFQSVGKSARALFLACAQNGLFYIPLLLTLPKAWGVLGIELSQPISYVIAACVSVPFLLNFRKKLKEQNKKEN
ncbi:MAG: MATE family efflux transporter [Clostridiales bacterium]|nr:MATE family efflux transporter [Clostridiales bacterium]